MKQGYKLNEIDEMDIGFYFELVSNETNEPEVYIDQIL
ncbi:hypothetical protein Gp_33 [Bacillus phage vB_Bacillus_1020A]|nr:hypothetical protein Gp_33 [Bacillus phage vB_Bacillus_1020A]